MKKNIELIWSNFIPSHYQKSTIYSFITISKQTNRIFCIFCILFIVRLHYV
ncbi:hypothetical protein BCR36DRAFT_64284 [Piromyces finnis]|uniref:Uncharacterized protein n=1 Tax=Piromyces finnis TaxID=1754191 RepID=A0A1Y1V7X7_9FUNG|nr:hypothetical protein BCR36DRAFT_64284 [Piromyces finnis]|eukprot:ORX49567.1 hypothetical protein BCR36DRAFT_64284 [Piromyces finnis]